MISIKRYQESQGVYLWNVVEYLAKLRPFPVPSRWYFMNLGKTPRSMFSLHLERN